MADNKILIEVSVAGNAEIQLKKLANGVEEFGAITKKTFFDAGRIFDNFVANLASNAVTAAFGLIQKGFSEFTQILGESIQAASQQEDAVNKLNSALKISGQFSEAASRELQDFAEALELTTKFSDEAVLSATSLISSLGQLDKEGLKKATQAATELAAVLGIDLENAARIVGKAATGEIGPLKRLGFEIKDTGDKSRDFAKALEEINKKFGGSAAAQVNTFSGALAVLHNQYNSVLESLGDMIIKSPLVIEAFKVIGTQVHHFSAFLKENKTAVQAFVGEGLVQLVDAFRAAVLVSEIVTKSFKIVTGVFQQALEVMLKYNVPLLIFSQFSDKAADLQKALVSLADGGFEKVKEAVTGENGFTKVDAILLQVKTRMEELNATTANGATIAKEQADARGQIAQDELITQIARAENAALMQETEQSRALASYANSLLARNEALKKFDTEQAKQQIAANNSRIQLILGSNQMEGQKKIELTEKVAEAQRQIDAQRAREQLDTLGRVATLSTAKTRELAVIGKAAAIALATIDTYKGANSALAVVPFPFNFAAAAAVITAGLVNVSNIVGTPLATGITQVPSGFQNDTFPARLSSGERVVSAPQNRDLTEFLAGSTGLTSKLDQLISVLSSGGGRTVVNIGGREIINAIQGELDSGRNLIV